MTFPTGIGGAPRGGGTNVASKLALYGGLLVALLGVMFLLLHVAQKMLPQRPVEPSAPAAAAPALPGGQAPSAEAATSEAPKVEASTSEAARPAETAPAKSPSAEAPAATPKPEPPAPGPQEARFPEAKPPAAPSDEEVPAPPRKPPNKLPILAPSQIDISKGVALLSDVKDNTYGLDEPALYYLLKLAQSYPKEDFKPDPPDKQVSWDDLVSMPTSWRGRPVTISGAVAGVGHWSVPAPEVAGVDQFWEVGLMKVGTGNLAQVFTVLVVDNPGNLKVGGKARVKGYFYKVRDYEKEHYDPDEGENRAFIYHSPVVIGKYVVPVVEAQAPPSFQFFGLASVGAGVVFLAMVFFLVRRLMARQQEFRRSKPREELTPEEVQERVEFLKSAEKSPQPPPRSPPF